MILQDDIIKVGKFQKTHALKGELNMISEIDPTYFEEGNPLIIEDDGIFVPFYAETIRKKGSSSYLVKLEGIDSESEATSFVNKEIFIQKKDAGEWIPEDILSEEPLIGFTIIDQESLQKIGKIVAIDDTTVNALFIVENEGEEIYIPVNEEWIDEVNEKHQEIIMTIPDGLIDINRNV